MGSRTEGGSKTQRILKKIVESIISWEESQYKKQKRKGQNERDQQR
jgi:hypothetical protein